MKTVCFLVLFALMTASVTSRRINDNVECKLCIEGCEEEGSSRSVCESKDECDCKYPGKRGTFQNDNVECKLCIEGCEGDGYSRSVCESKDECDCKYPGKRGTFQNDNVECKLCIEGCEEEGSSRSVCESKDECDCKYPGKRGTFQNDNPLMPKRSKATPLHVSENCEKCKSDCKHEHPDFDEAVCKEVCAC